MEMLLQMDQHVLLLGCCVLVVVIYGCLWVFRYGPIVGSLAALMRGLWLLPFLTLLIPQKRVITQALALQTPSIAVLIDDSQSMKSSSLFNLSALSRGESFVEALKSFCVMYSCRVEVEYASRLDPAFLSTRTPLRRVFEDFLLKNQDRPWFLISDGGVEDPMATRKWQYPLFSGDDGSQWPGFVVGFAKEEQRNISLQDLSIDELGFSGSPVLINVAVLRSDLSESSQTIQLAVLVDGQRELTRNIRFDDHSHIQNVQLQLIQKSKGVKLIEVQALPLPAEEEVWDNRLLASVEILPHTSSLLHIQGNPGVDGRFLRRFLKMDPRFDVISFFILRDPWDVPAGEDRELSLIPFPVDKLFNEELEHFQAVILQNFRLSEFISPRQQKQLQDYVEAGGSILFLGGPRAFHISDLLYSPLEKMIPFALPGGMANMSSFLTDSFVSNSLNNQERPGLPWYDAELSYSLEAAPLSEEAQSSPAISLYNSVLSLKDSLQNIPSLEGMHRMEDMKFSSVGYLPILNGRLSSQKDIPFLSASYLGKGRLIWVFSDALWQVAMNSQRWDSSRDTYNALLSRLLQWLTRDEKTPPLAVERFDVFKRGDSLEWSASLSGVLVPHIKKHVSSSIEILVCAQMRKDYVLSFPSKELMLVKGEFSHIFSPQNRLQQGSSDQPSELSRCDFSLTVSHAEFGEEVAQAKASLPKLYDDNTLPASARVLEAVADMTKSLLVMNPDGLTKDVRTSLQAYFAKERSSWQLKEEQDDNAYWFFEHWLYSVFLLAMPLEVIIRRRLFGMWQ
ncbi:MAG: hypothetical protein OXC44_00260 [Proteobacteria bacterium]|nr:hypothetical protein [Pseudomonadota bacterium]